MPAVAVAGNIHAELWGYKGTSPDGSYNEPFMKWLSELSNTMHVLLCHRTHGVCMMRAALSPKRRRWAARGCGGRQVDGGAD